MTLRKLPFVVVNNVFEVRSHDSIAKCVYVSYTNLLGNPPIRHRRERCWKKSTCPSAHATDITEPGASDGTCTGYNSQTLLTGDKKSKNCAQKHMAVPGHAVRWAHRAIGVASLKFLLAPRQELLRCSHTTSKLYAIDIVERHRRELELVAKVAHW